MRFSFAHGPVQVNIADRPALEKAVRQRLAARHGFALATLNLDHLAKLGSDRVFHGAYQAQDFVVADGNPIVWLARLAGTPLELMPGSDLVVPLCHLAAEAGVAVGFIGSTDDALEQTADTLRLRVPGLRVVSQIAPPMGFDPMSQAAADTITQLREDGAGLCFLALGAPKQEILAARARALAPEIGFVSVGAGLDFLAGHQTRAPQWVRDIAMEWLWRAATNPSRLVPRYARCAAILPRHALAALRQRG